MSNERLTWIEIQRRYPDQWVGLVDVEYEEGNHATIKSALVKYSNMKKSECTRMTAHGDIIGRYTTPDSIFQLGAIGVR